MSGSRKNGRTCRFFSAERGSGGSRDQDVSAEYSKKKKKTRGPLPPPLFVSPRFFFREADDYAKLESLAQDPDRTTSRSKRLNRKKSEEDPCTSQATLNSSFNSIWWIRITSNEENILPVIVLDEGNEVNFVHECAYAWIFDELFSESMRPPMVLIQPYIFRFVGLWRSSRVFELKS